MKRKSKTKIKTKSNSVVKVESSLTNVLPFHETFPITLTYKKDKENKVCYFQCKEHLQSYLSRYKLNKNTYIVSETKPREKSTDE